LITIQFAKFARIPLALALASCSKTPPPPPPTSSPVPVTLARTLQKNLPLDLRAIGHAESISTVEIKAQVGGELLSVNFQEGQDVQKGDSLFTIQPLLYATLLAQAQANLAKDRALADHAQHEAERSAKLGSTGAVSAGVLDQTRATAIATAAAVQADEAIVKIASVRLGYATIKSPINGRTGTINVQAGNLIKDNADTAMTTIKQIAPIYVAFAVPEKYLATIQRSIATRPLLVSALDPIDSHPLADGTLTFISNSIDITTGTIILKASFPNENHTLWPGAFVDVLLHLDTESNLTVVPSNAIINGQNGPQIFTVNDSNTAELHPITVGRSLNQETVVLQGVTPGQLVVTNGQLRLVPGSKIVSQSPPPITPIAPPR
jgi:multidrug efflux system membrane fusion protein